jgi:hypothetical protein
MYQLRPQLWHSLSVALICFWSYVRGQSWAQVLQKNPVVILPRIVVSSCIPISPHFGQRTSVPLLRQPSVASAQLLI